MSQDNWWGIRYTPRHPSICFLLGNNVKEIFNGRNTFGADENTGILESPQQSHVSGGLWSCQLCRESHTGKEKGYKWFLDCSISMILPINQPRSLWGSFRYFFPYYFKKIYVCCPSSSETHFLRFTKCISVINTQQNGITSNPPPHSLDPQVSFSHSFWEQPHPALCVFWTNSHNSSTRSQSCSSSAQSLDERQVVFQTVR